MFLTCRPRPACLLPAIPVWNISCWFLPDFFCTHFLSPRSCLLRSLKLRMLTVLPQVMLIWVLAFWVLGNWVVPLGLELFGLGPEDLTARGQAFMHLVVDLSELGVTLGILWLRLRAYRPLARGWFPFKWERGSWIPGVLLACLLFPVVDWLALHSQVRCRAAASLSCTCVCISFGHPFPFPSLGVPPASDFGLFQLHQGDCRVGELVLKCSCAICSLEHHANRPG